MRKIFYSLISILIISILSSCKSNQIITTTSNIPPATTSTTTISTITSALEDFNHELRYAENIDDYYKYDNMRLYDGDKNIPLYNCKTNFSNTWNGEAPMRMNNAVGIIELSGRAKFHLETEFNINEIVTIRPLAKNVWFDTVDKGIDFIIEESGDYTIEFSSQRTLHLFVYDIDNEDISDALCFSVGINNKNNSNYIDSNNKINVKSNTHYHLPLGSIVEARFLADNKNNVKITGHGIVAGAKFDRSVERSTTFIPFEFNYVNNLNINGIVCLDPAGWCYNIYFCKNVKLDNVKIITSRSNGDGISIQSCQDVYVENAFVRSWDDSLVVKNYPKWSDRSVEGTTRNINFKNCLIWTDLAQSLEIGYETVGEIMDGIHFENITILHNFHKAVISIHNGNNANVKNVSYKNIICEDAKMGKGDGNNVLIDIQNIYSTTWSNQHKITPLGFINDVSIENVYIYNANNPKIIIAGTKDSRSGYDNNVIHDVNNVSIKNLFINGNLVDDKYEQLIINYANNVSLI